MLLREKQNIKIGLRKMKVEVRNCFNKKEVFDVKFQMDSSPTGQELTKDKFYLSAQGRGTRRSQTFSGLQSFSRRRKLINGNRSSCSWKERFLESVDQSGA